MHIAKKKLQMISKLVSDAVMHISLRIQKAFEFEFSRQNCRSRFISNKYFSLETFLGAFFSPKEQKFCLPGCWPRRPRRPLYHSSSLNAKANCKQFLVVVKSCIIYYSIGVVLCRCEGLYTIPKVHFCPRVRLMKKLQGVPTSLEQVKSNVLMLRSLRAKRATFRKKCILLQKIAFSALFVNCKIENGIFQQLFSNQLMQ